jgi:hypothetical protein
VVSGELIGLLSLQRKSNLPAEEGNLRPSIESATRTAKGIGETFATGSAGRVKRNAGSLAVPERFRNDFVVVWKPDQTFKKSDRGRSSRKRNRPFALSGDRSFHFLITVLTVKPTLFQPRRFQRHDRACQRPFCGVGPLGKSAAPQVLKRSITSRLGSANVIEPFRSQSQQLRPTEVSPNTGQRC